MKTNVTLGILFLCILECSDTFGQMCPLNPPKGPMLIYEDEFEPGWGIGGWWGATTATQVQTPGQGSSAKKSILINYPSAWGGMGAYEANFSAYIFGKSALSFRIRKETSKGDIYVGLHRSVPDNTVPKWLPVSSYLVANQSTLFVGGQWYSVRIPLSQLQISGSYIQGVVFQSSVADKIYVDDIWIVEEFKLPLPGGKSWLLTTEVGDQGCNANSPPLPSHIGNNYFSLDFDDISQEEGSESNVSVLAVGGGKVIFAGWDTGKPCNGWHVVIDHDYDGDYKTGIITKYLHIIEGSIPDSIQNGANISRGQKLGILGKSGSNQGCGSWSSHIHIGFYQGTSNGIVGSYNQGTLANITVEGRRLADYIATCVGGNPTQFFPSSNTQ